MKKHEIEAFAKSFLIFFLSLELLIGFILLSFYQEQRAGIEERIFLEMKSFSYTLKGDAFGVEIAQKGANEEIFLLNQDELSYYAYFPIPSMEEFVLKISYPKERAASAFAEAKNRTWMLVGFITFIVALFSLFYSYYSLSPLRRALHMTEEFVRDMIHDLNTPITAMLLNIRMLRKGYDAKRLERLEQSARTIGTLHTNLSAYLNDLPTQMQRQDIAPLVAGRVAYFASLYPALRFETSLAPTVVAVNGDALTRIVDNLLGNACKYNRSEGRVSVTLGEKQLIVRDTGIGIREPKKVFERFYKEGERGLGIGLHIVKKLCDQMGIAVSVDSSESGSAFTLVWR